MLNRRHKDIIDNAASDLEAGESDRAIEAANQVITEAPEHTDGYFIRAKANHKKQDFGGALNDYHRILEIEPDNEYAKSCIKMINDILYIQNNHFFADPYTDEDHIKGL